MLRSSSPFLILAISLHLLAGGCGKSSPPSPEATDESIDAAPAAADASAASSSCRADDVGSCVDRERLAGDISWIASARTPGSQHWQLVQDECAARLEGLGFAVERHEYGTGTNVIGTKHGNDPEHRVIVSAHYDHIEECPGAGDNAAGLAAIFEIARVLSERNVQHTLVIACWDEEESGLVGSEAFAARVASEVDALPVAVVYSFDSYGYSDSSQNSQSLPFGFDLLFPDAAASIAERDHRGDFLAVFGDGGAGDAIAAIATYAESIGQPAETLVLTDEEKSSPLTEDLRRSDHASFWAIDIPAIHINDTANFRNPNYHCQGGSDEPSTLDYDFVTRGTAAVAAVVADQLD